MRRCENCGGTGKDGWIKGQAQERDCKLCKGSGVDPRECPTCEGWGIVADPHHGHSFRCDRCRGTGTLTNPK